MTCAVSECSCAVVSSVILGCAKLRSRGLPRVESHIAGGAPAFARRRFAALARELVLLTPKTAAPTGGRYPQNSANDSVSLAATIAA